MTWHSPAARIRRRADTDLRLHALQADNDALRWAWAELHAAVEGHHDAAMQALK